MNWGYLLTALAILVGLLGCRIGYLNLRERRNDSIIPTNQEVKNVLRFLLEDVLHSKFVKGLVTILISLPVYYLVILGLLLTFTNWMMEQPDQAKFHFTQTVTMFVLLMAFKNCMYICYGYLKSWKEINLRTILW